MNQGKYKEAEPLYQRVLAIEEQELGTTHPSTATTLNNLATLYDAQGQYKEAEPLYQRALAIRKQALGPTHPDTAESLSNLAGLYRRRGRYKEAGPLYQRALEVYEQQLGVTGSKGWRHWEAKLDAMNHSLAGFYAELVS